MFNCIWSTGTGNYDIEDVDDFEYREHDTGFEGFVGVSNDREGVEEDEKLLEDLEEKQLNERIAALENENNNIKEQVWKLEHGRTWVEVRFIQ